MATEKTIAIVGTYADAEAICAAKELATHAAEAVRLQVEQLPADRPPVRLSRWPGAGAMTRRFKLDGRRWHIAEAMQRAGFRGPIAHFRMSPPAMAELMLHTSVPMPPQEKECRNCGAPPAAVRCFYCGEMATARVRLWIRDRLVPAYADPDVTTGILAVHPWGDETEITL